jgi:DNA-directed RNA polymerase sigma subunit (sigma70/sigma32)
MEEAGDVVIQELLIRADQRGYVTFEDVLEVLDEDGDDVNAIETILYELDELGVELRPDNEPPDPLLLAEEGDSEFEPEEILQDPTVGDISAVSADDPVGLYFRQMAQEPLLTALEEIDLAKRIEMGKQARETLLRMSSRELYSEAWIAHLERLVYDGQAAREHLGRANTRLVVSIAKRYMGQGLPFPDLIQELLIRADQRGYVTFEDVLEVLDEDGDDVTAIETILYELDELGVELRQENEPPDPLLLAEEGDPEFEPEEILQDPTVGDISAVSADDPVGLYFRQMAQEPLLTAIEEIDLAKRIEMGKQARETLLRMSTR